MSKTRQIGLADDMIRPKPSLLLTALGVLSVLAWSQPAPCQTFPAQAGPFVTIDVTDVPLRTALAMLFNDSGKTYVVGTFSTDRVSLHIRDASFQTALTALLIAAQPPLTYDIGDDGTYYFRHISPGEAILGSDHHGARAYPVHFYKIPLAHVPAQYILDTMRGALTGGLKPVDWQSSPIATEIDYIIIDRKDNSFLVASTVDGFEFFKEIVRNLDQPAPPPKVKVHK